MFLLRRRASALTAQEHATLRRLIRHEIARVRSGRRLYVVPASVGDNDAALDQLSGLLRKLGHLEVHGPGG